MTSHPFGLPDDYQDNPRQHYDASSRYWTEERIRNAHYYQASVYAYAEDLARKQAAKVLVDVGCGVGTKLQAIHRNLPGLDITGYDQAEGIAYCREQYDFGQWLEIDLEHPDSAQAIPSDIVICADVIEHLENPDPLLGFLRACLKPGGVLVLSTPDRIAARGPVSRRSPNPAHIREWSRPELRGYLESQGFRVIRQRRMMSVPWQAGRLFINECLRPLVRGRSFFANQVCECVL
ncbi:MAG TPA: methyltransferase domain-containing protein [Kiritimatiellia bacterium]|nr:methyltransferase domain-containing protein [Kiritimatiellia bacterium]HMO98660.1 methyltransferase domain-containing protein [Kiritimatiellia bacterium]HMP90855.1 methyltransferase domain-containing protein [Kiritimatiellia bacterium]